MERGSKTDILRDREKEGGREKWMEGGNFGGWGWGGGGLEKNGCQEGKREEGESERGQWREEN